MAKDVSEEQRQQDEIRQTKNGLGASSRSRGIEGHNALWEAEGLTDETLFLGMHLVCNSDDDILGYKPAIYAASKKTCYSGC